MWGGVGVFWSVPCEVVRRLASPDSQLHTSWEKTFDVLVVNKEAKLLTNPVRTDSESEGEAMSTAPPGGQPAIDCFKPTNQTRNLPNR